MSVSVQQLTKVYGQQKAIHEVSFSAGKGEVLGFLGPNGAGKTTTMKIITCFIPPSSGTATVCGYDTAESPLEVRKRVGYLPEHNPLYKEMYVKEYLHFVAGLHRLPGRKQRVADMIERTGLGKEQHKLIGALSKGYRQRVGLAQAMIHDPEVLILDEPTSGLDPNQLAEIRQLIKQIGEEKTVILSTHIMQEVQAICNRVLIINQGKIVADDPIELLTGRVAGEAIVFVEFLENTNEASLSKIPGVKKVQKLEGNQWQLSADRNEDIRADVFRFAVKEQLTLTGMQKKVSSVEDVFQLLTRAVQ